MEEKTLPIVGISCGDPNGIGIEVILKSLDDNRMLEFLTPIIFSNNNLIKDQITAFNLQTQCNKISSNQNPLKGKINIINVWEENFKTEFGKATAKSGELSYLSLKAKNLYLPLSVVNITVYNNPKKNIQNKNTQLGFYQLFSKQIKRRELNVYGK